MTEIMSAWGWVIAIALQFVLGLVVRSMKNSFASKDELKAVEKQHQEHEVKLTDMEGRLRNIPAASAMHDLSNSIERLRGDLKVLNAELSGTNGIIQRLENTVQRHESIFAQGSR